MIHLLYKLLSRRVRIRPTSFRDHRAQWQIDRGWQLLFDVRVRRNLMERDTALRYVPEADFIPPYLRAHVPTILQRQAL